MKLSLLRPKSNQSIPRGHIGREARRSPLKGVPRWSTPNQQRATLSGVILTSTRRALRAAPEAILLPSGVTPSSGTEVNRLFNQLNNALSALQVSKMAFGSDSFISVNRP